MGSPRFWLGSMLCVAVILLLATFNVIPGYNFHRIGSITGHITCDGQPVTSGMVLFVANDGLHEVLARGLIDTHGDYYAMASWESRWEQGARFTMWVIPYSIPSRRSGHVIRHDSGHLFDLQPIHPRKDATDAPPATDSEPAPRPRLKSSQLVVNLVPSIHHIDVNLTN